MNCINVIIIGFAVLVALTGCGAQTVLGQAPQAGPITAVAGLKPSQTLVTLSGTMVEKCPVAGCWFKLKDKTGLVKVNLISAGFVVMDVPLNTTMTVSGKYQTDPEPELVAVGLRY